MPAKRRRRRSRGRPRPARGRPCTREAERPGSSLRGPDAGSREPGRRRHPPGGPPRLQDVVRAQSLDEARIDVLHRYAELLLESDAFLHFRDPSLGRRQEHAADLFEERRAEVGEEPRTRLREPFASGAVVNCCRTPLHRSVAGCDAALSQRVTLCSRLRRARGGTMLAPIAPAPATTIRATAPPLRAPPGSGP